MGAHTDVDLQTLQPASLPGDSGRSQYDTAFVPAGPVGLLLHHTHLRGATIDMHMGIIHAHHRVDIRYLDMPYQLLMPTVLDFAFDRVHIAAARNRTVLKEWPAFDRNIYHRAIAKGNCDPVASSKTRAPSGRGPAPGRTGFRIFRLSDPGRLWVTRGRK